MKIGDKVKVIELEGCDKIDTDLEIGSIGVIKNINDVDICLVDFGDIQCRGVNREDDGTYQMNNEQLVVIN
jgi:hypothetical protein